MRKTLLALACATGLALTAAPASAAQPPEPFVEVMGPVHLKDGPRVQVRWRCPAGEASSLSIDLFQDGLADNLGYYLDQTDFVCTGKVQTRLSGIPVSADPTPPPLHKGPAVISVSVAGASTTQVIKIV